MPGKRIALILSLSCLTFIICGSLSLPKQSSVVHSSIRKAFEIFSDLQILSLDNCFTRRMVDLMYPLGYKFRRAILNFFRWSL